MVDSVRVGTLISGAVVVGDTGHGVLGADIPSSGINGASYLYNDLTLPDDADKEIRGEITTWPPLGGELFAWEDGSFTYTGVTDYFEYQLYEEGVLKGSPVRVDLTTGGSSISGTGALSAGAATIFCRGTVTPSATVISGFGVLTAGVSSVTGEGVVNNTVTGTGLLAASASVISGIGESDPWVNVSQASTIWTDI